MTTFAGTHRRSSRPARWPAPGAGAIGLLILVCSLGCAACGPDSPEPRLVPHPKVIEGGQQAPRSAQLQVAGRTVTVELAYSDEARARGLMARTRLEPDCGMLFLFTDEKPRRFWMRDTLIGLDIAFLDETGQVLNIEHGRPGVEVPGYSSAGPARFVLEMAQGWSEEAGLVPGDRIEIPDELRQLAQPGG